METEELKLYLLCSEKGFKDGDLYEALCDIERTLHAKIRKVLMDEFGCEGCGWWRKGVPKGVREDCVKRWENDEKYVDYPPYSYTTFGDLGSIIKYKEKLFLARLPLKDKAPKLTMESFGKEFTRLTKSRNIVMHRIGAVPPSEDDFFFVESMQRQFDLTKWR